MTRADPATDRRVTATQVLQLTGVRRVHGKGPTAVTALAGIDLTVRPGEFIAVMGPSGSGKSTLLQLAGGLDTPTAGSISVEGFEIGSAPAAGRAALRRNHIGYVFQDFNLLPTLTAGENVSLPLDLDGLGRRPARRAAQQALAEIELDGMAERFPDAMSGGPQQRGGHCPRVDRPPPTGAGGRAHGCAGQLDR